jgi:hypothetical protein
MLGLGTPAREATRPLADLAGRFRFNTTLLDLLGDGLEREEWHRREGKASSALWVVGHLVSMRLYLLRTLSVDVPECTWEDRFAAGTSPSRFAEGDPSPSELLQCFRDTDPALGDALLGLSAMEANEVWAREGPEEVSVASCVGFFYFDETFHLGQLGLIRQMLGKKRVI